MTERWEEIIEELFVVADKPRPGIFRDQSLSNQLARRSERALTAAAKRIAKLEVENAALKGGGPSSIVGRAFHKGVVATKDATISKLEARELVLVEALIQVGATGHNDDCIFCGFKDRTARAALKESDE